MATTICNDLSGKEEYWESSSDWRAQVYRAIDDGVKRLCRALWEHGLETRWSCSGEPGHMCSRAVVILAASEISDSLVRERIQATMRDIGIAEYWLSRVYSAIPSSSGMQEYWMIQLPNPRIDEIAYPIAYRRRG
jgi:hypothetical protein